MRDKFGTLSSVGDCLVYIVSDASAVGRTRSIIRTLLAILRNVQNAEFRFNALGLQHMFDSVVTFNR